MGTQVPKEMMENKKNEQASNGGEKTNAASKTEAVKNKNKEHGDMFNGKKNHG